MELTPQQQATVDARGDVLIMAGAGTGKTRALVQRALRALLDPAQLAGMDRILMVTFTEAAAAEMRHRIRTQLEAALDAEPANNSLQTQLALLDTAHISTLDSFCFELVRQHFYDLGLDPQLSVLATEQARLVASEVLDGMFKRHYTTESSEPVRSLIRDVYDGWEKPLRDAILALHDFTQTRPNPMAWLTAWQQHFAQPTPDCWLGWLQDGARAWRDDWIAALEAHESSLEGVPDTRATLQGLDLNQSTWRDALRQATDQLEDLHSEKKPQKPLDKLMAGAQFLRSLCPVDGQTDPLAQDWEWTRGQMTTFLKLGHEFAESFGRVKRDAGALDFQDIEQFALRLLWDAAEQQPTPLARQWQDRFELVFVDEYQDINAAQDLILRALSRDSDRANRFMVGDVKQSIYRFRQANPRIFQNYAASWSQPGSAGQTLFLSENFRSHESLLRFVNAMFDRLMWPVMGGVRYDEEAHLRFGAPERRAPLAHQDTPRVEVHLRLTGKDPDTGETQIEDLNEADSGGASLLSTEWEARLVAGRLQALRSEQWSVWDEAAGFTRPVQWKDMVILLRAPAGKVESYAKEFARAGIPLQAKRVGFYETTEVQDLLSLLVLLDNPLQDIPCLAVLRSPLVGLDVNELARIRLALPDAKFWAALQVWRQHQPSEPTGTVAKVDRFLEDYQRWRSMARHASLAQRLETILADSNYLDWLLTQPRGEHRRANVQQLLGLARQFDEVHRQGLYRFLDFIEAQKDSAGDREPAPLEASDAVRLMSIHQSKGLEFPVVVIPDLAKPFNLENGTGGILLDDAYGPCPLIRPPGSRRKYPSLPRWLAQQKQRADILGEELRLLYVAATRARDLLILTGTCARSTAAKWSSTQLDPHGLRFGSSFLHWLGPWLNTEAPGWIEQLSGCTSLWRWQVREQDTLDPLPSRDASPSCAPPTPTPGELSNLRDRLAWQYPFLTAVGEPAKTSVTALRRRVIETQDTEARPLLPAESFPFLTQRGALTAAAAGTAHHLFAQHVSLDKVGDLNELEQERSRLTDAGLLSQEEAQAIDLTAVHRFWQSSVGQRFLSHREQLQRELPFTVRLDRSELTKLEIPGFTEMPEGDFIVAQGVIDLAVLLSKEIWLLDFKTDQVRPGEAAGKRQLYAPQLRLYAHALERVHQRPVTFAWLHFLAVNQTVEMISPPSERQLTLF